MSDRFIVQSEDLFSWDTWVPLTYRLNEYDTKKSFSLIVYQQQEFLFHCRLYYLNSKKRKSIGLPASVRYELGDVWLSHEYQGKSIDGLKYSTICFALVNEYLSKSGIHDLVLWARSDNKKAIKRYRDLGFEAVEDPKILAYYKRGAKRYHVDDYLVMIRTR